MLNTRSRGADRSKRYVASASHRAAHLDSRPSKAGLEGISGDTAMAESETRTYSVRGPPSAGGPGKDLMRSISSLIIRSAVSSTILRTAPSLKSTRRTTSSTAVWPALAGTSPAFGADCSAESSAAKAVARDTFDPNDPPAGAILCVVAAAAGRKTGAGAAVAGLANGSSRSWGTGTGGSGATKDAVGAP